MGLADEQIATKAFDVIKQNQALLKVVDNTLTGTINGIEKSFKAFVKDSKIISVNMYPGISGRITQGTIIDYGNLIW